MAILGFSVLTEQLLDRSKSQTIRLPRKRPFKVGEKVYIYWHLRQKDCVKLGEGVITKIVRKALNDVTWQDAYNNGFRDSKD